MRKTTQGVPNPNARRSHDRPEDAAGPEPARPGGDLVVVPVPRDVRVGRGEGLEGVRPLAPRAERRGGPARAKDPRLPARAGRRGEARRDRRAARLLGVRERGLREGAGARAEGDRARERPLGARARGEGSRPAPSRRCGSRRPRARTRAPARGRAGGRSGARSEGWGRWEGRYGRADPFAVPWAVCLRNSCHRRSASHSRVQRHAPPTSRRLDHRTVGARPDEGAPRSAPSGHEHRRSPDAPAAQVVERVVRARERIRRHLGSDPRGGGEREELVAVPPREVRDRADRPLTPEERVRKRRDVAHVDAGADDRPAGRGRAERSRDERSDRGEQDRGVERLGRRLTGRARPLRPERAREGLGLGVASAREREDALARVARELRDDVACRAESVQAEPLGVAHGSPGAVADEAGAEERRGLGIGIAVRDREGVPRVHHGCLREASVEVVPGEARPLAQILAPRAAGAADAARPAEPRDADAVAGREPTGARAECLDPPHHLVPEDERQLGMWQLAVDDVEVGAADAARGDLDPELPRSRDGEGKVRLGERRPQGGEDHRAHGRTRTPGARAVKGGRPPRSGSATTSRCREGGLVVILRGRTRGSMAHPTDDRNFRLPLHVRPTSYDAMLSVDLDGRRFAGTIRIDLELVEPSAEIVLHGTELDVARARLRVGGRDLDPVEVVAAPASETIVVRFAAPLPRGPAALELGWAGRMTDGLRGLYPAGDGLAATQFEAADARRVFPCFDEPGFKAPWKLAVEAPQGVVVLSNGAPVSEEDLGGRRRVRFAETPPLPTYLVALVLGQMDAHPPLSVRGVPVRTFAQPAKLALTGFGQDVAVEVLPRLEDYFGVPYAFRKLDQVGLPKFEAGAMENAGLVTYREVALLLDPQTASLAQKKRVAEIVTHELAHQWFGNWVTMTWWDDLWLNEAFATWMAFKIVDQWNPAWRVWLEFDQD